jgi:hypothetical protein
MLLMAAPLFAKQITVKFEWDPNVEPTMGGYALFQRVEGGSYDYNQPIDPPCTVDPTDLKCYVDPVNKTCQYTHVFDSPDGQKITYYWVARARTVDNVWSEDSNEVTKTIDLTALPTVSNLTAVFNKNTQTIDFTWTQPQIDRIKSWKLYSGTASGGPYTEILDVPYDGVSTTIAASIPGSTVPPGETYYFVIVSFADFGIFSQNSNEVMVDRRPPSKVIQLKITVIE